MKPSERVLRARVRPGQPVGRRRTDFEPNRGWKPVLGVALAVAALDWTTKAIVAYRVPLGEMTIVWEGKVALWHVKNPAMILGLYGDLPLEARKLIALVSAILAIVLLFEVVGRGHRLRPGERRWVWLFVGLTSGGMLGNLGERALHWSVTDFLSFRWGDIWLPPGNVADLAIFLSIPLCFVVILFELRARARRRPAEVPLPEAGSLASGD